jgi:hypothetical protein
MALSLLIRLGVAACEQQPSGLQTRACVQTSPTFPTFHRI